MLNCKGARGRSEECGAHCDSRVLFSSFPILLFLPFRNWWRRRRNRRCGRPQFAEERTLLFQGHSPSSRRSLPLLNHHFFLGHSQKLTSNSLRNTFRSPVEIRRRLVMIPRAGLHFSRNPASRMAGPSSASRSLPLIAVLARQSGRYKTDKTCGGERESALFSPLPLPLFEHSLGNSRILLMGLRYSVPL